jgi:hypothetical protein
VLQYLIGYLTGEKAMDDAVKPPDDANQVIRMDQHFDVDSTLEAVARERFAMPTPVIAAFRQAAMKGVSHLLTMVEDKDTFQKLKPQDQLKVLELIFDRAYGKSETASTSMVAMHKTGSVKSNDHGKQLDVIEQRMIDRKRQFPELKQARSASPRTVGAASKSGDDDSSPDLRGGGEGNSSLPAVAASHSSPRRNRPITRTNSLEVGSDDEVEVEFEKVVQLRGSARG